MAHRDVQDFRRTAEQLLESDFRPPPEKGNLFSPARDQVPRSEQSARRRCSENVVARFRCVYFTLNDFRCFAWACTDCREPETNARDGTEYATLCGKTIRKYYRGRSSNCPEKDSI